jgi:hypothetical protein
VVTRSTLRVYVANLGGRSCLAACGEIEITPAVVGFVARLAFEFGAYGDWARQ